MTCLVLMWNFRSSLSIEIDNISKTFHLATDPTHSLKERLLRLGRKGTEDFRALRPLTVDIPEGQTVGILGHNGSGKSTLLKCIAGIETPDEGKVTFNKGLRIGYLDQNVVMTATNSLVD